jgi:hypothetical protein
VANGFARFSAEVDNLRIAVSHAATTRRHHITHTIVANVELFAFYRPVWEVFDWVRPLQLEHGWTDEAIAIAAFSAYSDWTRGTHTGDLLPIGGVPEQALVSNTLVMHLQTLLLTNAGNVPAAVDVLERYEPQADNPLERIIVGRSSLMIGFFRAMADEMSLTEIVELDALGESVLETTRQTGGIIDLALTLAIFAFFRSRHRPSDATALAQEAVDAADGLRADALSDFVRSSLAYSTSRALTLESPSTDVVLSVRTQIVAALERKNLQFAAITSFSLLPLLSTRSPETSILMWLVWRQQTGVDMRLDLEELSVAIPDDIAPLEQRAARMTYEQVLGLVIDELDRLIADAS